MVKQSQSLLLFFLAIAPLNIAPYKCKGSALDVIFEDEFRICRKCDQDLWWFERRTPLNFGEAVYSI